MLSPESPSRSAIPSADGDAPKDNTNTERETKSSVVTNAAVGRETKPPLFQNNNPSSSGLFKSMNRSFIEGSTNNIPTINNSAPTETGNGAAPRPCTNAFRSGYDSSPSPPLHQDNKAIPLEGYKSKDNSPTNASSTKKLIQKKQEEEYNTQDPKLQTSKSEGNGNGSTKIGGDIKKHGTLIGNAKLLNSSSAVSSSGDDAKQFNLGNNLQQVIHDKKKDTAQSNHSIKLDDRHRQMGGDNDSASPAAAMFMARMLRVNQVQLMQVAKPVPVSEDVGAFTSKDHPQDIPMSSKVVKPTPTNASAGVASKAGYYKQDIPMPSKVVKPTNASAGVASKAGCYKLGMGNEINAKHTNPSPSKRMNGESSTSLGVGIQKTVVCELKHAPPVAKTNTDNNVNNEMVPVEIPKAVAFKPVPVETPQDLDCAPYLVSTDGRILKIPKAAASKPVLDVEGNPIELNPNDVILSFTNDFYKATLFARFRELKEKKEKIEVKIEANAMIQFFKKRGGRLVKLVKHGRRYEEVNDEVALTKLSRDFTAGRSETMSQWNGGSPSPKKRKGPLRYKVESSSPEITHGLKNPSRKRNKPLNFMDAQGQDMLVQEHLRKQSAKAKKRKRSNTNDMKPFIANENRQFEQGCERYGWGNWEMVQTLVPFRTSEECEEYAAMIIKQHPEIKDRLDEEHKQKWVYPDGERVPQAKKAGQDTALNIDSTQQSHVRKSSRAREGTWKTKDSSDVVEDAPPSPKATKRKSKVTKRGGRSKGEDEPTPKKSNLSASKGDVNATGRPKRQSAINARKLYAMSSSGDEDSSFSSRSESSKRKLNSARDALLNELTDVPPSNGKYYDEESAWRFHNPAFLEDSAEQLTPVRGNYIPHAATPTAPDKLLPLPSSMPLPKLPETNFCKWTFDEKSRVLLANFREYAGKNGGKIIVDSDDEDFLFKMMERDDVTVISEGLADAINSSLWSREYIEGCIGTEYHHKFRGFETICNNGFGDQKPAPTEKEGWYSMKVSDYFNYLEQREAVKSNKVDENGVLNKDFTFTDSTGKEKIVDVDQESLYMIDVDLVKLLPQAFENFQKSFKLPAILPGGSHCMMNAVNRNGRPFMGPNLYITPPSSFTHFHQDGHGTVDSGHLCLSGYNEVVMLRRLTERHKCHAIQLLTGTADSKGALYGLPHRDGLKSQLGWPTNEAIGKCEEMGYYPSVFVLKPGQVVHINKGRLHAFRKLAPSALEQTDCHFKLRNEVLQTKENSQQEDLCFSVAWDWMFKGVTSDGINREVTSILECSRLNQQHDLASLAIPETTLLFLAKENIARHMLEAVNTSTTAKSLFTMNIPTHSPRDSKSEPDAKTVLRGILPSLQYVVNRHNASVQFSEKWEKKTKRIRNSWRVSIDSKPNTHQDPGLFALDPYGESDFFCKFCLEELSNVYMHCDGCEKLLNKDFNICSACHMAGKYKCQVQMHPFHIKRSSIINHTGDKKLLRQDHCPCRNGKPCQYCSYCTGCSCRCHQWFTLHYRFMELGNELDILRKVENIVGSDVIPNTAETKVRLLSLISDDLPQVDLTMPQMEKDMLCQVIEVPKKQDTTDSQQAGRKSEDVAAGASAQATTFPTVTQPIDQPQKPPDIKLPHGKDSHSVSAPEIGPGWEQMVVRRKNGETRSDRYYISPEGTRLKGWKAAQRHISDTGVGGTKYPPKKKKASKPAAKELGKVPPRAAAADEQISGSVCNGKVSELERPGGASFDSSDDKSISSLSSKRRNSLRYASSKEVVSQSVRDETSRPIPEVVGSSSTTPNNVDDTKTKSVTFHCDKCRQDLTYADPRKAPTAFANHMKACDKKKKKATTRTASKGSRRSRANSTSSLSTSNSLQELASLDGTVSTGVSYDYNGPQNNGLDSLARNDRVIVRCEKGQNWQATILSRHERNNVPGFFIHYKGMKKREKKSDNEWVTEDRIVALQREEKWEIKLPSAS